MQDMTAKKKTETDASAAGKKESFEKSLGRLEKIVEEMEGGTISLEKMMAYFEEGQTLVKSCTSRLGEIECRIEKLVQKDGEVKVEPLDEEPADEEDDDLF